MKAGYGSCVVAVVGPATGRGSDCVTYLEELREVIRRLHGADAAHLETVPVKETFKGKTVWEGVVEVFEIHGHPTASRVYACGAANAGEAGLRS